MAKLHRKEGIDIGWTGLKVLALVFCVFFLMSCDQAARHKTLTTLFDGVPSLPPEEDLCKDYVAQLEASAAMAGEDDAGQKGAAAGSIHSPYGEKDCSGCHETGKSNELIRPRTELCFVCHVDFIEGDHVHGPVAVGDCLACHLPHTSRYSSLLVKDRSEICTKCHKEERLAAGMHEKLSERGMPCVECHGAHFGNNQYFLK